MATRQQRKVSFEASPPPRRTTIPPPANDNRARTHAVLVGVAAVVLAIAAYLAYRLVA